MEFRPCIDIHNGTVKQIVGSSLTDTGNRARENFVSDKDAAFYARFYRRDGIKGGHVILLNHAGSTYYERTKQQALSALRAYPGGLQAGGGICAENAEEFLAAGASHVIVTSYVFSGGKVDYENLQRLVRVTGKERLVLDLSCRMGADGAYYIVTDRWQRFTSEKISLELLERLSAYADEFLVHAVDVEGRAEGIEVPLVRLLGSWGKIPVTYAGGIGSFADLKELKREGMGRLNVTVGSALDLFGGAMEYRKVLAFCAEQKAEGECIPKALP